MSRINDPSLNHTNMTKVIRFQHYNLHIDPTFWSTLYGRKLDVWKLDDGQKPCGAVISNNTVYLDRSSLDVEEERRLKPTDAKAKNSPNPGPLREKNETTTARGIIRVFNTRDDLTACYEAERYQLLKSPHEFIMLVHADLKQYSFDYFFALPTMEPASPFTARGGMHEQSIMQTDHPVVQMQFRLTEERHFYELPYMARNRMYLHYMRGARFFEFPHGNAGSIRLHVNCEHTKPRYVGWNKKKRDLHVTMITVNLAKTMDPKLIAEQNAELNLKLMMWKHEPNLPLDRLRSVRCLLIGAGTVGCTVARNLIAWGIRNITFVDCATVSHSNPVRQNLYTPADIGKYKAEVAAEALTAILPSVKATGHVLDVPMPGHPHVGSENDYNMLEKLVKESDVIFLSTDSREGRWLPILLAQIHNVPVMNIALGYESLLIQHITRDNGCFFCQDSIGPRDTMSTRTIDEKCTITRPGISYMASAMAVEFYVDMIRGVAKHHMIRYRLGEAGFLCHETYKNPICSCCSPQVVSALTDEKFRFIEEIKQQPDVIEDLSGYTEDYTEVAGSDIESYAGLYEDTNEGEQQDITQ